MAKIVFRLDAGPFIGSGHYMRCLVLAEELAEQNHEVRFLCRNQFEADPRFPVIYFSTPLKKKNVGEAYSFPCINDELPELLNYLQEEKVDCLIVDHYGADANYFAALHGEVSCLVAIDDLEEHAFPVDIVINGCLGAENLQYPDAKIKLLGVQYRLLRKEFRNVPPKVIREKVEHIYITSGGSDPCGFCQCMLQWLSEMELSGVQLYVVVGPLFEHDYVSVMQKAYPKAHFIRNANMRQCMDEADLFITAAGGTLYELAACGVPSVCFAIAKNQVAGAVYANQLGITCNFGIFGEVQLVHMQNKFIELIRSPQKMMKMHCLGIKYINVCGTSIAVQKLNEIIKDPVAMQ